MRKVVDVMEAVAISHDMDVSLRVIHETRDVILMDAEVEATVVEKMAIDIREDVIQGINKRKIKKKIIMEFIIHKHY
jgi:hypothetical protein